MLQAPRSRSTPNDAALQVQRTFVATGATSTVYRHRKTLLELACGIHKGATCGLRFLLRSIAKVRAAWSLLATVPGAAYALAPPSR